MHRTGPTVVVSCCQLSRDTSDGTSLHSLLREASRRLKGRHLLSGFGLAVAEGEAIVSRRELNRAVVQSLKRRSVTD